MMHITCKKCKQWMDDLEAAELIEQMMDGNMVERICETCIDEMWNEDKEYINTDMDD